MIVFHTSNTPVPQPDVLHSRKYLDFGQGFYVTPTKMQAVNYAQRFTKWGEDAFLNYISACRLGLPVEPFDIIEGGIADDKVYNTIDLYFAHQIAKDEALRRLIAIRPNQQVCFLSQQAIDACLTYLKTEILK